MFTCVTHGWTSAKEPCIACHPRPKPTGMAAKWEQLQDLFAPYVEQPDGTLKRDPEAGVISQEDAFRLMDFPDLLKVDEEGLPIEESPDRSEDR